MPGLKLREEHVDVLVYLFYRQAEDGPQVIECCSSNPGPVGDSAVIHLALNGFIDRTSRTTKRGIRNAYYLNDKGIAQAMKLIDV